MNGRQHKAILHEARIITNQTRELHLWMKEKQLLNEIKSK